jgi:hypothetical protein
MTYSEASTIVQAYTKQPLLESLERIKGQMEDGVHIHDKQVRAAYYTLMAGFTELMG